MTSIPREVIDFCTLAGQQVEFVILIRVHIGFYSHRLPIIIISGVLSLHNLDVVTETFEMKGNRIVARVVFLVHL